MLPRNLLDRIDQVLSAEMGPRDRALLDGLRTAKMGVARRGMTGSQEDANAFGPIAANELRVRGGIVWGAISRSHQALVGKVDATTLQDLQQQLAQRFDATTAKVRQVTLAQLPPTPRRDLSESLIEVTIANISREVLARFNVEASFYVDQLQAQVQQPAAAAVTINNSGNIGAVQTGAYSVAQVNLDDGGGDRLAAAIEALRVALQANAEATADQRAQGGEIAGQLVAAVRAEKPNPPLIAGLFSGLATTVQTIASLQPAWQTVRDAAIAVGILTGIGSG